MTQQDLQEIKEFLMRYGKKDTDFTISSSATDTDKIAIVQGNENKLISMLDLAAYFVSKFAANTDYIDNVPTEDSTNLVKSGGVYSAINGNNVIDTDQIKNSAVTTNKLANNAVTTDKISTEIANKLNTVDTISEKIPSAASSTNQLADKNFVLANRDNAFNTFLLAVDTRSNSDTTKLTYHEETGYYSMNGLTDLTLQDVINIYGFTSKTVYEGNLNYMYYSNHRTNYPPRQDVNIYENYIFDNVRTGVNQEVLYSPILNTSAVKIKSVSNGFIYNSPNLKVVKYFDVSEQTSWDNQLEACYNLEELYLKGLKASVSIKDSDKLTYESMEYIVNNATNTSSINIKVHPTIYGYLNGTITPATHADDWTALKTTALNRNITFIQ